MAKNETCYDNQKTFNIFDYRISTKVACKVVKTSKAENRIEKYRKEQSNQYTCVYKNQFSTLWIDIFGVMLSNSNIAFNELVSHNLTGTNDEKKKKTTSDMYNLITTWANKHQMHRSPPNFEVNLSMWNIIKSSSFAHEQVLLDPNYPTYSTSHSIVKYYCFTLLLLYWSLFLSAFLNQIN